jgi:hypothetical protein
MEYYIKIIIKPRIVFSINNNTAPLTLNSPFYNLYGMKKVSILITGLNPHSPENLIKSIKDFTKLRDRGIVRDILFSTWIGEIDKAVNLRKFLIKNKVIIIENEEPKTYGVLYPGPGNVWCQTKTLDRGLSQIDEDTFVLKTRTDIYIKPEFLLKLFSDKSKKEFEISKGIDPIFSKKIWIPWFEMTVPFYVADECFFGLCKDLKKLIHYDASYFTNNIVPWAPEHLMRFIHPFRNLFPILETYLKYTPNSGVDYEVRVNILKENLQKDTYLHSLAIYYYLLKNYFFVETPESAIEFREWSNPGITIDENKFKENFSVKLPLGPLFGKRYVYDKKWLNNVVSGKIKEKGLYDHFYEIYKNVEKNPHSNEIITNKYIEESRENQLKTIKLVEIARKRLIGGFKNKLIGRVGLIIQRISPRLYRFLKKLKMYYRL